MATLLWAAVAASPPGMVLIPAGSCEMGDHHGFMDPKHGGDETPVHTVRLDAFYIGINTVTTREYCGFLNEARAESGIEVRSGGVYLPGGNELLCETRERSPYSPTNNPPGPASGSLMPDGKPYRGMRGGNWYNGENGHGRVSNRNPSYFRGPQDPDHPYYHLGFRLVLPVDAESRPVVKPTPVQQIGGREGGPGGRRAGGGGRQGEGRGTGPGGGGNRDNRPPHDDRPNGPR